MNIVQKINNLKKQKEYAHGIGQDERNGKAVNSMSYLSWILFAIYSVFRASAAICSNMNADSKSFVSDR